MRVVFVDDLESVHRLLALTAVASVADRGGAVWAGFDAGTAVEVHAVGAP